MHEALPTFVREPNPGVYLGDNWIVLDVETTNREHGTPLDSQNSLLLACWRLGPGHPAAGQGRTRHKWADEFGQSLLGEHVLQAAFLVAHHAKFEIGYLRRCGLDLRKLLCFDTMIGEKVLAGNIKRPLSLDATAARRGLGHKEAVVALLIKAGVCPSQIPQSMLREYCEQDVALTEQIFLQQRQELAALSLLPVAYCRNLVTPALADIEFNGMKLDKERVHQTYEEYSQAYASVAESLSRLTGGINPKSPKQMREFIYGSPVAQVGEDSELTTPGLGFDELRDSKGNPDRTATGGAKVDKHTLAALAATTPEQIEFKKHAVELAKLKVPVQNLTKMMKICEESPDDPRMFFTFNQTLTDTDRLSCTSRKGGLQGQNIDRVFKKLFCAGVPGSKYCESDGVQLEFRMAVHLGRDKQGLADILASLDVHQVSADYHGSSRQAGKARTFRPLFGGKSGTPRERRYIEYFKSRYSGIFDTQTRWTMDAARDKFIVTETGSRFYFPEAEIQHGGYVAGTTKIFNYPIQQLSTGDTIPLVLVLLWHLTASMEEACVIRNTVHDSVVAEVTDEQIPRYKEIVKWCFVEGVNEMLKRLYGIHMTVPMGVGIKVATHWSDTDVEETYDVTPDGSYSTKIVDKSKKSP